MVRKGSDYTVCGFNCDERYSAPGAAYIHGHHLTLLVDLAGARQVSPIRDLRPLCPNCHAMLHRNGDALTIEEFRARRAT